MYESEEVVAECLQFLRKELAEFKKEDNSNNDDEDLDTEKENSKQRAFTIIGKKSGTIFPQFIILFPFYSISLI